jgi:hypothetical protein
MRAGRTTVRGELIVVFIKTVKATLFDPARGQIISRRTQVTAEEVKASANKDKVTAPALVQYKMSDNPFEDPSVAASSTGLPAPDWLENDDETEMVMVSF